MGTNTFILNETDKTILDEISKLIKESDKVECAVAYLTYNGWELLRPVLREWLKNENHLFKLIVRKENDFPDENAVKEIIKYTNIELKLFPSNKFHVKQWIFYQNKKIKVLTGSANVTQKGLKENTESNILNELSLDDKESIRIRSFYSKWWDQAHPVKGSSEIIKELPSKKLPNYFKEDDFDEITATIKLNNNLYFCFLRLSKGSGMNYLYTKFNKFLSIIINGNELGAISNYQYRIGINKSDEKGDLLGDNLMNIAYVGRLSNKDKFFIYASGTKEVIKNEIPILLKLSNLEDNWQPIFTLESYKRGKTKTYFSCPSIKISYRNKIPHTYFGFHRTVFREINNDNIFMMVDYFHKNCIEDPQKTIIDSVYRIEEGSTRNNRNKNGILEHKFSFIHENEYGSSKCFTSFISPELTSAREIKDTFCKIFDGVKRSTIE